jgi:YD repeat-containing protein
LFIQSRQPQTRPGKTGWGQVHLCLKTPTVKQLLITGVAWAILGITGCSRTKEQSSPVIQKRLVKWENIGDPASATSVERDVPGRITRMETATEINLFSFSGDSVLFSEFSKADEQVVYQFQGILNKLGALVSGTAISSYGLMYPDTVTHLFEYDAAGYLVKETRSQPNNVYTIQYSYKNADAVKITTYSNNILYNTKELEYYTDRDNQTGLEEYKFRKNCNGLAGKTSRHLVKKITSVAGNGKINYSFTYEYETDAQGLPVKLTSKTGKKVNSVTAYYYVAKL